MSFVLRHIRSNLWSGRLDIFPEDRLVHGFSARQGGVSPAPFDALNMALHVGDDPACVWENRTRYFAAIGLDAERICTIRQVHGTEIVRALRRDAGRGARDYADALADAEGVVHAGWKGTVARIAAQTIVRMGEEFGTAASDVLAGIGPSISADCYTVGAEVAEQFRTAFPAHVEQIVQERDGAIHLDLWAANRVQMLEAGVLVQNIDQADICTSCDRNFFYSYRADGGRTGRLAAVMELR